MSTTIEISPQDLPDWMRRARQGVDWGLLLVIAFSLTIAMPFIIQTDLPHTNASENYVYRSADYAAALQEGRLYPRWSANAFGGYGAPIPEYYPPTPGYASALIQVLLTDDPLLAVRIIYVLAFAAAGAMVYLFVMRRAGAASGLLAGTLYVYSPYVGLTAPHILGDLPGVLMFAFTPMLLWSVDRLLLCNRPLDILLVALSTSALYLTNPPGAIAGSILAIILVIWHCRTAHCGNHWLSVVASYALGISISSFYWIPALLEQNFIHWHPPTIPTDYVLTLGDLLSPLRQLDVGEMVHSPQLTLGLTAVGFAIAGLMSVIRFRSTSHFQVLFLGIALIFLIGTLLLFSQNIWLLGVISLCMAIGSSAVIGWRDKFPPQWRRLYLPSLLILIWILSSPVWLPPLVSEPFGDSDDRAQVEHEQQGYGVAVLPPSNPVPSTLPKELAPSRYLLDGYQSQIINKIEPSQFTANAQAGLLDHNTHSDHFQIRANTSITLEVLTAYFPGWRATVSDRVVPLTQDPETGLMRVDLPALSSGELVITLGSTPIRTAAWLISWDALLIVLIVTWGRYRRYRSIFEELFQLSNKEARLLAVVLAAIAIIIFAFNYIRIPLSLRMRSGYELQNSTLIQNRTDAGLSLLAFRLENNQFHSTESVHLTLYWQAQRFLSENYRAQVYLVNNRDGNIWSQTNFHYPGNYPTRRWKTGLYVTDDYRLSLPANITPGNYQITVNVSQCNPDCASGELVTFFDFNGQVIGTHFTLPTLITVSG
jgi:hypothetical protein